jgi:Kef-type K+ transport system membrane component KefB
MFKNVLFYIAILLIFGMGIFSSLKLGAYVYPDHPGLDRPAEQSSEAPVVTPSKAEGPAPNVFSGYLMKNLQQPLGVLLLQVIVVLASARAAGALFHRLFRLRVVGEIIAGILLGPSLLGMLSPNTMNFLFPPQSLDILRLLSQIGVILFMFTVGTELNVQRLRQSAHAAVLVSHASIIIPFFLGAAFSLLMYRYLAPPNGSYYAFALFISVSMSITAFPVLARILEERRLLNTHVGSTAIACAAVDDITAWCLLAVVVAIVKAGGFEGAILTIVLTLLFIVFMLRLVKPQVERMMTRWVARDTPAVGSAALILVLIFASALFTEIIGIHALFGAFLAGVVMPSHNRLRTLLTERLELLTTSFLLPLFFAFSGLRTQIGLINGWTGWLMCAGVILIAVVGKLFGSALAARLTGMSWNNSLAVGILMNTRGLVELIVLNVGYDLGILTPAAYSIMVLMALATTFMTGPLLSLLETSKERGVEREGVQRLSH